MTEPLTDKDPMPFGKHEGVPMEKVPAGYLDWLSGQSWIGDWPLVEEYITKNRDVIDLELKEEGLI